MRMTQRQIEKTKAMSFLLFSVILTLQLFSSAIKISQNQGDLLSENRKTNIPFESRVRAFEEIEIQAESVAVFDINSGTFIYEKNSSEVRPIASITKVISALVSGDEIQNEEKISIGREAIEQVDDNGLLIGEIWPFKKLLDFSLLVSSNDGAYAIANIVGSISHQKLEDKADSNPIDIFVQKMNQKTKTIGLKNTFFNNPSGLDVNDNEAGGYSSAREVAMLFSYITKNRPGLLEATALQDEEFVSDNNISHDAKNTNTAFPSIPSIISSKTGYTKLAGGNLAIVYDIGINRPVAIVVLGSGYGERFTDMTQLVKATNKFFSL